MYTKKRQKSILTDDLSECSLPIYSAYWIQAYLNQVILHGLYDCYSLGSLRSLCEMIGVQDAYKCNSGISIGFGYGGVGLGLERDQAAM